MEPFTYFTDKISLSLDERLRHIFICGATGSGKSSFLLRLALGDVTNGHSVCIIDPHGALAHDFLNRLPSSFDNRVAYINFSDPDYAVGIDLLSAEPGMVAPTADALVAAMHSVWHDTWGPELERILRHSLVALIESRHASIALLPRLLTDQEWRNRLLKRVHNPITKSFFDRQYNGWTERLQAEKSASTLNKIESLLISEATRSMLGQSPGSFRFEKALELGQVVVVNLDHSRLKGNVDVVAALLISRLLTAASKRRANDPSAIPCHLIVDEASRVGGVVLQETLLDGRKYRLSTTLATQQITNLAPAVQETVMANAYSMAVFAVSAADAERLAPRFDRLHQTFNLQAMVDQPIGEAYLSIRGHDAMLARFPLPPPPTGAAALIAKQSRVNLAKRRGEIEKGIARAYAPASHRPRLT